MTDTHDKLREAVIGKIRNIPATLERGGVHLGGEGAAIVADAALSLMQPEIDRRVAEERARLRDELCRDAYEQGFWVGAEEQRICEDGETPHKDGMREGYQNWLANPPALAAFEQDNEE